ncbi:hypothetical protein [Chloroflexus sp.]|uniref:hypothetical protein n=1 Tax=Chloroflexus sp. TaxID=1904827 RepID=UPI0029F77177|nr:hypothetical protein [Chloroflexus sp.]MCS6889748.1 hypothetical protein [Chloroflexus sp.]
MIVAELIALVIYPGGLLAIGLGIGYRLLVTRQLPANGSLLLSTEWIGWLALATLALIASGLTGLPWPWHPAPRPFGWLGAWALLEIAAWLPLWPALSSGTPRLVRAAVREAQIGVLGRAILWSTAALSFASAGSINGWTLSGHLLVWIAGLFSLPAAINWGPFGPEPSLGPRGITEGLPARPAAALTFARETLAAALVAVVWIAGLPRELLPPWASLSVIAGGSAVTILGLGWLQGRLPRLSVPAAIRATVMWAGGVAVLAAIALGWGQSA